MQNKIQNLQVNTSKIWPTLILQNCLPLGKEARFTSKNVTQYLLGSRNNYNLFKFNEIKHLLLKFTPLIETLFRSQLSRNSKIGTFKKIKLIKPTPPKDPAAYQAWYEKMKNIKIKKKFQISFYKPVENKRPIKILFASTTPTYAQIIQHSAEICQMTGHTNRWLCGYITANSPKKNQRVKIPNIENQYMKTFHENKVAKETFYHWHRLNKLSHRPVIAIIPDIKNNDMILRETSAKDIPVIGLINSNDSVKIAYPIFGNCDSIQVIYFFCNFLSILIAKAFMHQEYKQNSNKILNRTRAYFAQKNKELKSSNIFPKSKFKLQKDKINVKYARKISEKQYFKNIAKFGKFKFRKKIKKNKRIVGNKIYWKNLEAMIYILKLQIVTQEGLTNKQQILATDFGKINWVNNKKQKQILKKAKMERLLTLYTKQLKKLNLKPNLRYNLKKIHHEQNLKFYPSYRYVKFLKLKDQIIDKIRNKDFEHKITKRDKKNFYDNKYKEIKFKKRKFFSKVFGHKKVTRKYLRHAFQVSTKILKKNHPIPNKKILKLLNLNYTLRQIQKIKNILKTDTTRLNNIEQIYNKLVVQNKKFFTRFKRENKITKQRFNLFLLRLSKNKKLFNVALKKYPYSIFADRAIFRKIPIGLKKLEPEVLKNEFRLVKKNPYTFSIKNFKRMNLITNNLFWGKVYAKQWISKTKKISLKQRTSNIWLRSKLAFRGPVKLESINRLYDFRKLIFFKNRKAIPKFLTKIKRSNHNLAVQINKRRLKSIFFWEKHQRKFLFKYYRSRKLVRGIKNKYKINTVKKLIPRVILDQQYQELAFLNKLSKQRDIYLKQCENKTMKNKSELLTKEQVEQWYEEQVNNVYKNSVLRSYNKIISRKKNKNYRTSNTKRAKKK